MLRADKKEIRVSLFWFLGLMALWAFVFSCWNGSAVPFCVFLIFCVPIWIVLSMQKKVILTAEGIYAYALFRGKPYPWNQIIQAGVLWRKNRTGHFNEMILLKQSGSPRKFQDDMFLLRNLRKAIRMDDNPEVRAYISQYYGPLDFDLADGKPEKSQVDESLSAFIESNH